MKYLWEIAIIITILFVSILLINKYQYKLYCNKDTIELQKYHIKDIEYNNIEKTISICYDISKYEAHYYAIIYKDFADKYNIPWEVYPAVIRIESNFNSSAISSKGAKGIAQVVESTGKNIADSLGIEFNGITLWNTVLCQIIGFTYLSEMIKQYGMDNGIKAYVGGPSKINSQAANDYKGSVMKEVNMLIKKSNQINKETNILTYVYKGVQTENKK